MKPATQIIHWPGKDVPACDDHAQQLRNLAGVLGFALSSTPCIEKTVCTNCVNEAVKAEESAK